MAIPIRTADVRRVLQPMLGTRFVSETALCDHAAELLRRYAPGRTTLEELARHVRDGLFGDLYELLGQHMTLQLDNGVYRRILLSDVDRMADDVMGVLLDVLSGAELTLNGLRDYAMSTGSLSAMRVLLQRYDHQLSGMEKELLRRIIRENHPAERYCRWMQ
ncbi:MAG: hypothetical protein IJZ74_10365 [Clostridia bacterium]|nr:hypothetical protein [Clostridia bacterium]